MRSVKVPSPQSLTLKRYEQVAGCSDLLSCLYWYATPLPVRPRYGTPILEWYASPLLVHSPPYWYATPYWYAAPVLVRRTVLIRPSPYQYGAAYQYGGRPYWYAAVLVRPTPVLVRPHRTGTPPRVLVRRRVSVRPCVLVRPSRIGTARRTSKGFRRIDTPPYQYAAPRTTASTLRQTVPVQGGSYQ